MFITASVIPSGSTGRQSARERPRGMPGREHEEDGREADASTGGADGSDAVEHVEGDRGGELARDRRHDHQAAAGSTTCLASSAVGARASAVIVASA